MDFHWIAAGQRLSSKHSPFCGTAIGCAPRYRSPIAFPRPGRTPWRAWPGSLALAGEARPGSAEYPFCQSILPFGKDPWSSDHEGQRRILWPALRATPEAIGPSKTLTLIPQTPLAGVIRGTPSPVTRGKRVAHECLSASERFASARLSLSPGLSSPCGPRCQSAGKPVTLPGS